MVGALIERVALILRTLIQYPCSLSDGHPDPWPVLYCLCKNVPRFIEIIAGIQQAIDLRTIFGPLLDLVKIAVVRTERVGGLLVGPIIHAQRTKKQLSTCRSSNGCYEIAGISEKFQNIFQEFN